MNQRRQEELDEEQLCQIAARLAPFLPPEIAQFLIGQEQSTEDHTVFPD